MTPAARHPDGRAAPYGRSPKPVAGWSPATFWASGWRADALALGLAVALAALAAYWPVPTLGLAGLGLITAGLARHPPALALALIALMANTKFNLYVGHLGAFTVFPEYLPLFVAVVIVAVRWMARGGEVEEGGILLPFGLFFLAGCLSFVNAIEPMRVFPKALLILVAGLVTWLVATGVRTERELERALRWLEVSACIVALYGIVQILGLFMNWDTGLRFLQRWGNPDFEYAVGAPVVRLSTLVFRANSLFNDPNILGGYLAAAFATVLALRLHHVERPGHRRRTHWRTALLAVLLLCQALTISRSGMLGTLAGTLVVLSFSPRVVRAPRFWMTLGAGIGVVLTLAALAGVKPGLMAWRMASSFDAADKSSSTHVAAALFALSLLARFPITGVGLRNFGYYYNLELDARATSMMSHNAVLSYFSEAGLLGGIAFLFVVFAIGRRPWRALRRPGAAPRPALHGATSGLFGALVALLVSNIFYDYSLRTFVWVFAGLAIAASRLLERDPGRTIGAAPVAS